MKKYLVYFVYLLVAILIMRPFFGGGFLFLLDMVWSPHIYLSSYLSNGLSSTFPLILILKTLSFVLSVEIIQKILLTTIFTLMGSFMYYFARVNNLSKPWAILSGLIYVLNPFVYERFLAGHWLVLLGYAFFPLVFAFFMEMIRDYSQARFVKFVVVLAIYPLFSIHLAYISYVFLLFVSLLFLWQEKKWKILKQITFLKNFFITLLSIFLLNIFWIFSFFSDKAVFPKITLNDFEAFKTQTDYGFGVFFNVLSLYGFWNTNNFLSKDFFSLWWVITVLFLALSLLALFYLFKNNKFLALVFLFSFPLILLLAVGYGSALTKPVINFLFFTFPGFKGLRETGKIIALIVFSYAFLVPLGLQYIINSFCKFHSRYKKDCQNVLLLIFVLIISWWNFGIFNAFNGQLGSYHYPQGYKRVEEITGKMDNKERLLILPWHAYLPLNFIGNYKVANPAKAFFSSKMVMGRNLDNVFLLETKQEKWDNFIFKIVQGVDEIDSYDDFLKKENIAYIVLLKTSDFERYSFLNQSEILKKEYEDNDIALYKLK